jgi:hypothetical protein
MTVSSEQMVAQFHLAQLAFQYYLAARFAALSHCLPVAGNLCHHAIELFLKGALLRALTLAQLKTHGHDLNKLWILFKATHPDPQHASLDSSVAELHKFARLRYPDFVVDEGMQVLFAVRKDDFSRLPAAPQPPYHLVLEDIDLLVKTAAPRWGVDYKVFTSGLSEHAAHFLQLQNFHSIFPSA